MRNNKRFILLVDFLLFMFLLFSCKQIFTCEKNVAYSMPFYDLQPQELVLRSTFFTSFSTSSSERKNNIQIASNSLNNTFIDVGAEFSFNKTVGTRTIQKGYKNAKIISNGSFIDGIGGGVCQVSTTLYNAVLLGGLTVTEYHPHSLPVSYVAPSFDAMVNSGSADLKFINNTHNPIIIKTQIQNSTITISIIGEPMKEKYSRKSIIKEEITPKETQTIFDNEKKYPALLWGEKMILSYGKKGIKSQGMLIKLIDGKPISCEIIRQDIYKPTKTIIVIGTS